jgi:hypothetical protein
MEPRALRERQATRLSLHLTRSNRTLRFTCRAFNLEITQASRMKASLFAVRCKRLFGGALRNKTQLAF